MCEALHFREVLHGAGWGLLPHPSLGLFLGPWVQLWSPASSCSLIHWPSLMRSAKARPFQLQWPLDTADVDVCAGWRGSGQRRTARQRDPVMKVQGLLFTQSWGRLNQALWQAQSLCRGEAHAGALSGTARLLPCSDVTPSPQPGSPNLYECLRWEFLTGFLVVVYCFSSDTL